MDLLPNIATQIAAVDLPLYAVTVTALPRPDTPVLLMLHWHGYRRDERQPAPCQRPVPGSAMQINAPWGALEDIDRAVLDAAWQLGAWDMERRDRRACSQVGASAREAMECRQAFGDNPFTPGDESHLLAEAPDRADLMQLAGTTGYVRWLFRPVLGGVWQGIADDDTLTPGGGRTPPCPVVPRAPEKRRDSRTVYRLGKASRLVVVEG